MEVEELRAYVERAPPRLPLTLKPTPESLGPYACPVCHIYKPGFMLYHPYCSSIICAPCMLQGVEDANLCPFCGSDAIDDDDPCAEYKTPEELTGYITEITEPPPSVQYWLDRIKFQCSNCGNEMGPQAAMEHRCSFKPKPHEIPKSEDQLVAAPATTRGIVSNPRATPPKRGQKDCSFIYLINNRQVSSRSNPTDKPMADVKCEISDLAGLDDEQRKSLRIYKFEHREVPEDAIVHDIATRKGTTWLAGFYEEEPFSEKAVQLSLAEIGSPPSIERPDPPFNLT